MFSQPDNTLIVNCPKSAGTGQPITCEFRSYFIQCDVIYNYTIDYGDEVLDSTNTYIQTFTKQKTYGTKGIYRIGANLENGNINSDAFVDVNGRKQIFPIKNLFS